MAGKKKKSRSIRRTLIAGALIALPIIITVYLLMILINLVSALSTPAVKYLVTKLLGSGIVLPPFVYSFMGFLATIVILFFIGLAGTNVFGRRLLASFDSIILRIPFVKSIYSSAQQLLKGLGMPKEGSFKGVVLVEYPRKDMWVLAFKTGEMHLRLGPEGPSEIASIFLPTTPNPTSGYLLFVPKRDLIEISIPVEEAVKIIVSGGIVGIEEIDSRMLSGRAEKNAEEPPPPADFPDSETSRGRP